MSLVKYTYKKFLLLILDYKFHVITLSLYLKKNDILNLKNEFYINS